MKNISIGNGKSETKTSTSSHCRINQIKKIKQEFNNVKIENHEHHRKTDKGCGSTHNVTGQTGSKLFSSNKRQLQK